MLAVAKNLLIFRAYLDLTERIFRLPEFDELPPHTRDFSRELGGFTCTIKVRMV